MSTFMEDSLFKDNPLLLPVNEQKTVYDGFISVQDKDLRIRIILPPDLQLKKAKLHCGWELRHLLRGYEAIVKQRLQQSADLSGFILELKTVLEVGLKSRPECCSIPPPQYYAQIISEMETLGWDKMVHIDMEFQTLKLKAEDSSGRQHMLTVRLKAKHPAEAPECSADLPVPLSVTWTPQSTLEQLYSQFLLVLEYLTEFWDVLDEIDEKTWILEPENPSRSDTMRRIAIGNNLSIKVEVDPRHPKMLPECCLLGAEHAVTPLRNKLNANMHLWASAWSAASATPIALNPPSLIKCAMTPAVASPSIRPVCMSGCERSPPADRASASFLESALTAASPSL
ncbi:E3 ubiquitin-protein ligase FANCL isoform X2 [Oryzias latipes]|uniref:E3 ubiquitin-protein ligase FANCL isoform X2 n=1 Tax=Oryzias latipes TaxID=8090 RepID=UPI0005CBF226|nr:E3 ubiquitin-protein ligase FANCL isoform X2 [Oryzias latipes]